MSEPLRCGYFNPCALDADHEGDHESPMYAEWQVPTIEPMWHVGRAVQDDGLPTVEQVHVAVCEGGWLGDRTDEWHRGGDEPPCADILARLRGAAPPLHDPQEER